MKVIRFPALFASMISEARYDERKQIVYRRTIRKGVVGPWEITSDESMGVREHGSQLNLWNHFCSQVGNPLYATNGKSPEFVEVEA